MWMKNRSFWENSQKKIRGGGGGLGEGGLGPGGGSGLGRSGLM